MGSRSTPAILLREATRPEPVEGETFSSNPAHPYWRVRVRFTTGLKPSMERIRAATAAQALEFVLARYPFASRSGSEVLGRWDAASAPIDHKAPVAEPVLTAPKREPMPTTGLRGPTPPLQPIPTFHCASKPTMVKPALGADLKRLPRDRQGRAVLSEEVFPAIVAANDGGMSWPVIADTLGCAERNMRERVAKWKRQQAARGDAKEALRASVAEKRQQGGPVPDGVPVGGTDPGKEVFVPGEASVSSRPVAQAMAELREAFREMHGASEGLDRDAVAAGWRKIREERKAAAAQQQPQPEPAAPPLTGTSDAMDPRRWDVSGPSGHLLAVRQPSTLSCRLMTVLTAAGVSCSRTLSADQPTPSPAITPTKAGGFTVQITVNPVESGG